MQCKSMNKTKSEEYTVILLHIHKWKFRLLLHQFSFYNELTTSTCVTPITSFANEVSWPIPVFLHYPLKNGTYLV